MTNGKIAVVSGGSKGLGKALCDLLLEQDWCVYTISRSPNKFSEQGKHTHITFDFTSEQSIKHVCDSITHLKIDLLINNAGIAYTEKYDNVSIKNDFRRIFQANFMSALTLTLALENKLTNGTVITISSDLSYIPVEGLSLYAASKSALNAWFASYAQSKTDVRFITMIPSMIDTSMLKVLLGEAYDRYKDSMMSPENLAQKILDIGSDASIKTNSEIFIAHPKMTHTPQELLGKKLFWEVESRS
ncbi:MAG: SDR family oxidoreductase [Myxococcota bacterium]